VLGKVFWWGFSAAGIVVVSFTYATGEAAAPMRGISAQETMTTVGSIASVLVALPWTAGWVKNC
jgi:hypothetical protein